MTYSQFGCCGNHQISANYVVDNLVMCDNRVNHILIARILQKKILNVKELAIPFSLVLLTVSSDLYLRNGAQPLRVAAQEVLHHHITALSVGIHRVLSVTSYFHMNH